MEEVKDAKKIISSLEGVLILTTAIVPPVCTICRLQWLKIVAPWADAHWTITMAMRQFLAQKFLVPSSLSYMSANTRMGPTKWAMITKLLNLKTDGCADRYRLCHKNFDLGPWGDADVQK